jgi:O-succinylbenzoate synthase
MKLLGIELHRVRMALRTPFRTSYGVEAGREILLVRVVTDDGDGWAECAAQAVPAFSSEYVDGAHDVIRRHLAPRLLAAGEVSAEQVAPLLAGVRGHQMAKAALETALLDAQLRRYGMPLARYLGAVRDAVAVGVSVGIAGSPAELLDTVDRYLAQGYPRIKLKIEPGWDIEPLTAVRQRFPDVPLQVDANTAYRRTDLDRLTRLDEFGLLLIEQPFAPDDLAAHAELARRMRTPICLDESVTSARAAATAIAAGACSIVNIKPARVGGYLEARRVHDVCAALDVPVWCGGMLETGLGRAANIAFAALPNCLLPGDISASERYWERDLTEPFRLVNGALRVPDGPGVGVAPDPAFLAEITTGVEYLQAEPQRSFDRSE